MVLICNSDFTLVDSNYITRFFIFVKAVENRPLVISCKVIMIVGAYASSPSPFSCSLIFLLSHASYSFSFLLLLFHPFSSLLFFPFSSLLLSFPSAFSFLLLLSSPFFLLLLSPISYLLFLPPHFSYLLISFSFPSHPFCL